MGKIMRNGVQYGVDTADVLSTVAECDASASGGKGTTQVASAKALSELNSNVNELESNVTLSFGGITFGIDADGNYGYKKEGEDTVIPFSSGKGFVTRINCQNTTGGGSWTLSGSDDGSRTISLVKPEWAKKLCVKHVSETSGGYGAGARTATIGGFNMNTEIGKNIEYDISSQNVGSAFDVYVNLNPYATAAFDVWFE